MDTINVGGQEYVLVPKDQVKSQQSTTVVPQPQNMPNSPPRSVLSDFIGKEVVIRIPPKDMEINQVRMVDARSKVKVAKAKPQLYDYWVKYKTKSLTPGDIMGYAGYNTKKITEFKDLAEIEADKNRPEESRLFYGPGVEFDNAGVV